MARRTFHPSGFFVAYGLQRIGSKTLSHGPISRYNPRFCHCLPCTDPFERADLAKSIKRTVPYHFGAGCP